MKATAQSSTDGGVSISFLRTKPWRHLIEERVETPGQEGAHVSAWWIKKSRNPLSLLTHKVVRVSQHHVFASKSGNKQTDLMLPVFSVLQRASSLKVCRGSYWGSSGARKCSVYRAGAAFCCTSYSEAFRLHFLPEVKLRGRIDERSEPPGGISVSWKGRSVHI